MCLVLWDLGVVVVCWGCVLVVGFLYLGYCGGVYGGGGMQFLWLFVCYDIVLVVVSIFFCPWKESSLGFGHIR